MKFRRLKSDLELRVLVVLVPGERAVEEDLVLHPEGGLPHGQLGLDPERGDLETQPRLEGLLGGLLGYDLHGEGVRPAALEAAAGKFELLEVPAQKIPLDGPICIPKVLEGEKPENVFRVTGAH